MGSVTEKETKKETTTSVRTETHTNTEGMTEGHSSINGSEVELTTDSKGNLSGEETSKGGQVVSTSVHVEKDPAITTTKKSQTTTTTTEKEEEIYLDESDYSSLNVGVKSKMSTSTNTDTNVDYNPFVVGFSAAFATGGFGAIWLAISDKKKKERLLAQKAASEAADLAKPYVDEIEKINEKNKIMK